MAQKDYKLEVVNSLIGKSWHVRSLAKELKINHMTILRKLNELLKENVLDYREEGKNKIYFLKTTSEAKAYIFMGENYKLNQFLKKFPKLRGIIEKIQGDKRFQLAMVFGSYAKDLVKKESDIDIYIETTNNDIKKELEVIDSRLSIKIGKYNNKSMLSKEIKKDHVIIKGVEKFYENYKFFE